MPRLFWAVLFFPRLLWMPRVVSAWAPWLRKTTPLRSDSQRRIRKEGTVHKSHKSTGAYLTQRQRQRQRETDKEDGRMLEDDVMYFISVCLSVCLSVYLSILIYESVYLNLSMNLPAWSMCVHMLSTFRGPKKLSKMKLGSPCSHQRSNETHPPFTITPLHTQTPRSATNVFITHPCYFNQSLLLMEHNSYASLISFLSFFRLFISFGFPINELLLTTTPIQSRIPRKTVQLWEHVHHMCCRGSPL